MAPSPYTDLIASCIPEMDGGVVADIGTGSGVLAAVALLKGAEEVYITDITPKILVTAKGNIERNVPGHQVSAFLSSPDPALRGPLPYPDFVLPASLPSPVDLIVSNPASLPLPPYGFNPRFYDGGSDGRRMIDLVLEQTSDLIQSGTKLLLAHTSLANTAKTIEILGKKGLGHRIMASRDLVFRPAYNREWFDNLGGQEKGLYFVRDGKRFERVDIFEITPRRR
jgi:methylase of polypeptide subunit release factors